MWCFLSKLEREQHQSPAVMEYDGLRLERGDRLILYLIGRWRRQFQNIGITPDILALPLLRKVTPRNSLDGSFMEKQGKKLRGTPHLRVRLSNLHQILLHVLYSLFQDLDSEDARRGIPLKHYL